MCKIRRILGLLLVLTGMLASPSAALAGMPMVRMTDITRFRLESISFFVFGLVVSAVFVRWLWNRLHRDFPRLPEITFGRAFTIVCLWGLLFVIVLTMISGARELMTPGAWQHDGFTYKLAEEPSLDADSDGRTAIRIAQLARLHSALVEFAHNHADRFPKREECDQIDSTRWELPGAIGVRYVYIPGWNNDPASSTRRLMAYEPISADGDPWVLMSDGSIEQMPFATIKHLDPSEKQP